MAYENRKYVIIGKDDVSSVDFSKVLETSADTLRYSVDGNKTFVQRIAFDHDDKEQAVRELGYLERNIKKEVARSVREEIVAKRDPDDIEQITKDNWLLDDRGIAISQYDIVEMCEDQGG